MREYLCNFRPQSMFDDQFKIIKHVDHHIGAKLVLLFCVLSEI